MYFYLFRVLIIIVLFVAPIILAIKNKRIKRLWILIISSCILMVVISNIPIENLFCSFDSPEDALAYQHSTLVDTAVIEGEESCLVYYKTAPTTYTHTFLKKDNGKYKLSYYMEGKEIGMHQSINGIWQIYRFGKTDDYYVSGTWFNGGNIRITQEDIDVPVDLIFVGDSFVEFYLKDYNKNTILYVNDTPIEFW